MNEPFDSIAKIFLGVLLATLFSTWRERRRDRDAREHSAAREKERDIAQRKLAFVAVADSLYAEVDQTSNGKFTEWCRTSIIKITGECSKIEADIEDPLRKRFTVARDSFCATKPPDIEDANNDRLEMPSKTYKKGRERMQKLLREIRECVK